MKIIRQFHPKGASSEGYGNWQKVLERRQTAELLTLVQCFMICTSDAETPIPQHAPEPSRKGVPQPLLIILKTNELSF